MTTTYAHTYCPIAVDREIERERRRKRGLAA